MLTVSAYGGRMYQDGNILTRSEWADESFWRAFAPDLRVADIEFLNSFAPLGWDKRLAHSSDYIRI